MGLGLTAYIKLVSRTSDLAAQAIVFSIVSRDIKTPDFWYRFRFERFIWRQKEQKIDKRNTKLTKFIEKNY